MPRNNPIPPAVAEEFYLAPIAQVWRALTDAQLLGHGEPADASSRLTHLELDERNGATRVRVIHSGFQTAKQRDTHADGWQRRLGHLSKQFQSSQSHS